MTTILAFSLLVLSAGETAKAEAQHIAIRQYLAIKYDEFENREGDRLVYGIAYNDAAPLVPVEALGLRDLLPHTAFYKTILDTNAYEYSKLKVLVAITKKEGGPDIRTCLSPAYTRSSQKFLALFHGITAETIAQRKQLVRGIADLMASITYKGDVRKLDVNDGFLTAELWHGHQHWRNITVSFDADGRVQYVYVINPKARPAAP